MNKYQINLNNFREQVAKNVEKQEKLKNAKENKKFEITKITLQNMKIDKELLEYTIMKKKCRGYIRRQRSIKKKYLLFTYSVVALEMLFLTLFPMAGTAALTSSIIATVLLLSASFIATTNKINKLDIKMYDVTRGLTKDEISKNVELLLLEKEARVLAIEEIKKSIINIDKEVDSLEEDILDIYDNYLIFLENYQEALLKIDPRTNDGMLETKINEDYNVNESIMLKKINKNKND